MFAFWSGHVGAVAGCRCRVLLQGVCFGTGLLVPLQGSLRDVCSSVDVGA